ncbi:hypothetical protein CFP56_039689 [Quercus suber]|uniref:Uncharacterized protein n=1 Tax=Quercus suber TaxID=58331 RepID=A0AAW0M9L0_QUESU
MNLLASWFVKSYLSQKIVIKCANDLQQMQNQGHEDCCKTRGRSFAMHPYLSVEEMKPNEEEESNDEKPEIPNCTITTVIHHFQAL